MHFQYLGLYLFALTGCVTKGPCWLFKYAN